MSSEIYGQGKRPTETHAHHTADGYAPFKVFIVDDSEVVRERVGAMIDNIDGVEVVGQAASAGEGLAMVHQQRPDFVVLDIRMPGGSGLEVLPAIKGSHSPPMVAVLTSYDHPAYRKRASELGADGFFYKGGDLDALLRMIEGLGCKKNRPFCRVVSRSRTG